MDPCLNVTNKLHTTVASRAWFDYVKNPLPFL